MAFDFDAAYPQIVEAAQVEQVPPALLYWVLKKENCNPGFLKRQKNQTLDLGVACINSSWEGYFAKKNVTLHAIQHDVRVALSAAAHILRRHYGKYQNWYLATMAYHTGSVGEYDSKKYARGWYYAYDVFYVLPGLHKTNG